MIEKYEYNKYRNVISKHKSYLVRWRHNTEYGSRGATNYLRGRGSEIVKTRDIADKSRYYAYNAHGDTTSVITKPKNETSSSYEYDAFGNIKGDYTVEGTATTPFMYNGQYSDNETGLIYLRARYYDPQSGRFTQEDPYWYVGNMIYGDGNSDVNNRYVMDGLKGKVDDNDKVNPMPSLEAIIQSTNLYIYCSNDPVNFVDPSGLDAIIITSSEAAWKQGHTSAIYQDENGDWYYTYWGNKAAAVTYIPDEYMLSLADFNGGLNQFLNDYGLSGITSDYDNATYVVGDFTQSLNEAFYDVQRVADTSYGNYWYFDDFRKSKVFEGPNSLYDLSYNNCLHRTVSNLTAGTLANGQSVNNYFAELGYAVGIRPNSEKWLFNQMFMNNEFIYEKASSSLINYVLLYSAGSPWAQSWEKADYANASVGYILR